MSLRRTSNHNSQVSLVQDSESPPSVEVMNSVRQGTSWYSSALIIVNAGLGASLLAFPQAYDLAGGIATSVVFITVMAIIALGSLIMLAYCTDQFQTTTYQETVRACCGHRANVACSVIIAIYAFGCSITYLIIIGDLWQKVFDYAFPDPIIRAAWYLDRRFIISISTIIVILPLCIPRRIDFLRYASAIGVFGVCYIGFLIVAEYFTDLPPPGPIKTKPTHWSDVFYVLPVICFGFQCHLSAIPVYSCMRGRPNVPLFALTSGVAILLCYLSYLATGIFGYLSFGSHVSADVLLDYPPRPEVATGLALLAIKTYTTYPILHFCGRSALETTLQNYLQWPEERWERFECKWRYSVTCVWFFTSLLLALFAPDIGLVIGLLGGIAGLFLLIFPGLCMANVILLQHPIRLNRRAIIFLLIACAYVVAGGFVFALTTTQAIMQFIDHFRHTTTLQLTNTHSQHGSDMPLLSSLFSAGHSKPSQPLLSTI